MNDTFESFNIDLCGLQGGGSLKIAALTFVVITVLSKYSPVPDCFAVDAQPKQEIIRIANRNIEKLFFNSVMVRSDVSTLFRTQG